MTYLSLQKLTEIAEQFLRQEYGLTLDIPVVRNNRLRSTLGAFVRVKNDDSGEYEPDIIELSGKLIDYAADSVIIDVLKHECIHYALHAKGKRFRDGESDFENELKRLGVRSNYDNDYFVGITHDYKCTSCDKEIMITTKRAHKVRCFGYSSRCCGAKLTYLHDKIHDGTGKVTYK